MQTFDCNGWVHVTVDERSRSVIYVKITHMDDHVPYCTIDIPDDVRLMVENGIHRTPSQVSYLIDLKCYS